MKFYNLSQLVRQSVYCTSLHNRACQCLLHTVLYLLIVGSSTGDPAKLCSGSGDFRALHSSRFTGQGHTGNSGVGVG